ncbi:hypothetical protein [Bacillus thuringiensis]|uniref:hypothetical protein n=1 Tax=Bacillus thuringiensis TaxID=1428 RepID=UPI000BFBCD9C|nr:hypothetical protein [Bacillus thuringiensis]PGT89889.1 hypothetical protein COD17_09060 [Bacillus thuringiensis]
MENKMSNQTTLLAIGEASSTRYEILLTRIQDETSNANGFYILNILNFGVSAKFHHLRNLVEQLSFEFKDLGRTDYANIQNILADFVEEVEKIDVQEYLKKQRTVGL